MLGEHVLVEDNIGQKDNTSDGTTAMVVEDIDMPSPKKLQGRATSTRGLRMLGRRRHRPPNVKEGVWGTERIRCWLLSFFVMVILFMVTKTRHSMENNDAITTGKAVKQTSANHEKTTAATDEPQTKIVVYSRARRDRTGASILDRLMCHAYAFQEGAVYGGACRNNDDQHENNSTTPDDDPEDQLTKHWGLSQALPWACPPPVVPNRRPLSDDRIHHIIVPQEAYFEHDTTIFTSDWQRYIRKQISTHHNNLSLSSSVVGTQSSTKSSKRTTQQVAVHIRRGDVTPCVTPERYLSNAYYLDVLEKYLANHNNIDFNVTIYSETKSYESWQPFVDRGYGVALDYDLTMTWQAFVTADVLILSKSSFSLVPALLRTIMSTADADVGVGGAINVIYTPFWHQPLSGWTVVPENMVQRYNDNVGDQCP